MIKNHPNSSLPPKKQPSQLGQLLISRFVAAYRDKNTTVPQRIESGSLLFNSVIEHT